MKGLKDDRTGLIVDESLHAFKIIHLCKTYISDPRFKGLSVFGVARNGQSTHGASVEGMLHGDYLMIRGTVLQKSILAGRFDGAFHSLGSAVGKEHAVKL